MCVVFAQYRRDRRVDARVLHRRDRAPDPVAFGLVDRIDRRVGRRIDVRVDADEVHAALGEEAGVMVEVRRVLRPPRPCGERTVPVDERVDGPEADRLPVAAHEVTIGVSGDEAAGAGGRFVEAAEVEEGVGGETVASRGERVARTERDRECRRGLLAACGGQEAEEEDGYGAGAHRVDDTLRPADRRGSRRFTNDAARRRG